MGWKKLKSRVIYDNPWMTVREDRVINPRGGENQYGHVQFKNRAVAILPVDADGDIWLVGQQRYTLDEYSWELPMGGAPLSEDPLQAAKRELREETGLTASRWSELLRVHPSNSITDELGIVYTADGLTAGDPEFDETEDLAIRKLSLRAALAMVDNREITDAISVAGLLYFDRLRSDGNGP